MKYTSLRRSEKKNNTSGVLFEGECDRITREAEGPFRKNATPCTVHTVAKSLRGTPPRSPHARPFIYSDSDWRWFVARLQVTSQVKIRILASVLWGLVLRRSMGWFDSNLRTWTTLLTSDHWVVNENSSSWGWNGPKILLPIVRKETWPKQNVDHGYVC